MNPATPVMPMGAAAAKYSMPANLMPPVPLHGARPPETSAQPIPSNVGAPAMPPMNAPSQPPYKVRPQADGSLAVVWPTPDGGEVISQVLPAPKTPPAFQTPK